LAKIFIEEIYNEAFPLLKEKEEYILEELGKEIGRFEATLAQGMKEFEKCVSGIARKNEFMKKSNPDYIAETVIGGKAAFRLYDTYGFPLELTQELAAERGLTVDAAGFAEAFKEHQEKSRVLPAGQYKGGLESHSEQATKYHTATHLLNAALKTVLSPDCNQKGSNITDERMRFDFNFPRPMTAEEVKAVEDLVNEKIKEDIPVVYREMSLEEARAEHFVGVFDEKYGDVVKTYSVGEFSKEMCGGPHVERTGVLGRFRIVKEQSSSAGIRRIKAVLE
ncbi:MAG: alanine--tRNA ligase-related protein, partial [Candidatus Gallimonas sp.]